MRHYHFLESKCDILGLPLPLIKGLHNAIGRNIHPNGYISAPLFKPVAQGVGHSTYDLIMVP